MATLVEVTCQNPSCGKAFHKELSQFNNANKHGWKHCCSRSCVAILGNRASPRKGDARHLTPNNKRDSRTPFRWYSAVLRARAAKQKRRFSQEINVDVEYLEGLWEEQKGICPYTGWQLTLPKSSAGWIGGQPINGASLDRIDNKSGYVKGNVQFVAVMANFAKNRYSDSDLIRFCKAVSKNNPVD